MKKTLSTTEIKSLENTELAAATGAGGFIYGIPNDLSARLGLTSLQLRDIFIRGIPADIFRQLQQYGY